jgi:hypothetical protein
MIRKPLQLLALLSVMACAPAATQGSGSSIGHDYNRITADELAASTAQNAYELINKSRPQYLKTRGRTTVMLDTPDRASVFMDGTLFGTPDALKNIPVSGIREIRFYPATEAGIKFGSQYGAGVIDIKTK